MTTERIWFFYVIFSLSLNNYYNLINVRKRTKYLKLLFYLHWLSLIYTFSSSFLLLLTKNI